MKELIKSKLEEIEKKENVRILHSVESGSRAWGFASSDSDYDVRFIYVRPNDFYLRLDKTRDVIEWQLDDTLDINGWDLSKALALLHESNPTLFEWSCSPIVYKTTKEWETVASLMGKYYISKKGLYHYLSTAKKTYREYFNCESVKLKKYFYVLRPLLACKWILSEGTPPPMPFRELVDKYLDDSVREDVFELLDLKMNRPEIAEGKRFEKIDEYLNKSILDIEAQIKSVPDSHEQCWDELNKAFLSILQ